MLCMYEYTDIMQAIITRTSNTCSFYEYYISHMSSTCWYEVIIQYQVYDATCALPRLGWPCYEKATFLLLFPSFVSFSKRVIYHFWHDPVSEASSASG